MTTQKPERKDWILLIFIIPIAALLLLFVGQWAIRLLPFWSVNAGMNSNLEPDSGAAHPFALLEPLLPQILIPLPWADTYLDPGEDFSFPPFLTFEPTASPSPTADTPAPTEATPTATPVSTETPTATSVVTSSPTDSDDDEEETPTGTATLSPSPSSSPTTPSPSATTPSPSATTPSPSPTTPSPTGVISTLPPGVNPIPANPDPNLGIDTPPDDSIGSISDGSYIILSLNVTVSPTPDNFYDLVFYEWNNGGSVYMDLIIIGITNDGTGSQYYEVFNWGNNIADTNSNVEDQAVGGEEPDEEIDVLDNNDDPVVAPEDVLYDPDHDPGNPPGIPETNGPLPQTGILIDVDNAASGPPPGTYNYVIIISPATLPGDTSGSAQVDAIQVTEVPIPTPTP